VKGDKGPSVRKVEVALCPVCDEAIEEGQEKTIVSGHEWHKWFVAVLFLVLSVQTNTWARCFRKVQGEQEVQVRKVDVAVCPECEEAIEEGQERTIISGKEYHKWCHQKKVGDKGPAVRKVDVAVCPECEEAIEEGQERTIISGKEYHKWCHQKKVGDKGPAVRKVKYCACTCQFRDKNKKNRLSFLRALFATRRSRRDKKRRS
jgi:uncharacterized protein YlaI